MFQRQPSGDVEQTVNIRSQISKGRVRLEISRGRAEDHGKDLAWARALCGQ